MNITRRQLLIASAGAGLGALLWTPPTRAIWDIGQSFMRRRVQDGVVWDGWAFRGYCDGRLIVRGEYDHRLPMERCQRDVILNGREFIVRLSLPDGDTGIRFAQLDYLDVHPDCLVGRQAS